MCSAFIRKNGWSLPLHPRQVAVWISLLCLIILYYGVFVHYLPFAWKLVGVIAGFLLLASHVIAHVITVSIDPGDNHVRNKSDEETDYYCEVCQVNVFEMTKHCRTCNKCVEGIDHHCLWLNNCIGSRNYWPFLVTLATGFVMVTSFAIFSLILSVMYFASPSKLCYSECSSSANSSDDNLKLFGAEAPDPAFIVIIGTVTLPSWIVSLFLGHLLAFHIYFIVTGTTTYSHIMKSRRENQKYPFLCCICPKRRNRVVPTQQDGDQINGNWVTSSDDHTASHETIATSHDT